MDKRAKLLILLSCLTATPVAALDLALPQGARLMLEEEQSPASYALPVAPFNGTDLPTERLEGSVRREAWRLDSQSVTNLQITTPLRDALLAAGYETKLDCADVTCGGFDFRFATDVLPPPDMFVNLADFRFLSARKDTAAVAILVSGNGTARFIQIIRVGSAAAAPVQNTGPVTTAPVVTGDLAQTIERNGHITLEDLNFETGSATLSDGPYASLDALATYLRANPGRRIALVGHTDSVGSLEGNIGLSRRRAEAVQTRLAESYDIPRAQMEAGGMGYLSPRATNLTEEGRAQNRRVEAVLTSTE
ncbi:OmpA family protein [Primorskyibacter sp. S187A]|uniref:OmpA family protein n=1 Tax=Primorskyibacter sp. S187A TaxID=3415130 RepID=UPI003C79A0A9